MGGSSAPPPPDYGPMAAATTHAADLSYQLGEQQLQQAQQQYSQVWPIAQQVAASDLSTQAQQRAQAQAYFDNWQNNVPGLQTGLQTANAQAYQQGLQGVQDLASSPYLNTMTGSDAQVYAQNSGQINPMVDKAIADARGLTTNNMEQAIRAGLRYGMAPSASMMYTGSLGLGEASNEVAAGNQALATGLQDVRNQAATGYNAALQNYGLKQQASQQNIGNTMGILNSYSGLPAASTNSYNSGTAAGQSGVAGLNTTGNSLTAATDAGNKTVTTGTQQQITGLGSIIGAQANYANTAGQANNSMFGSLASMVGTGVGAYLGYAALAA